MSDPGIFDEIVAAARRIDLGSNSPGNSPSIVAGFGVPVAVEATGSIYYRQDAPNASLMLYVRASNAWWPISSAATFVGISVNTEALLTAFDVTSVPDGAEAWIGNPVGGIGQSQDSRWVLVTQQAALPALSAHEVIASSAGGRVWQRLLNIATPRWTQQATWYIDPAAGNDADTGASGHPLKTFAEIARRVPVLTQPVTINYVGAAHPASTDVPSWQPKIEWNRSLSASYPSITINGVETDAALPVNATGIVNAASGPVGNVGPRLSDTGGAGVVWVPGTLIRVTSGAGAGGWCCVLKDEGGGVARVSQWYNAAAAPMAAPVGGSTYKVVTCTQIPDITIVGRGQMLVRWNSCHFLAWTNGSTSQEGGAATIFAYCTFPTGAGYTNLMGAGRMSWLNCYIKFGSSFTTWGAHIALTGCGLDRSTATTAIRSQYPGTLTMTNTVIQSWASGRGIAAGHQTSDFAPGGLVRLQDVGIFDAGVDAAINLRRGAKCELVTGTYGIYGAGNIAGLIAVEGSRAFVQSTLTPTLTGTTELQMDGVGTAIPALAAGVAVPAASALTTWAEWAAAPFSRNVVSYKTGSAILDRV